MVDMWPLWAVLSTSHAPAVHQHPCTGWAVYNNRLFCRNARLLKSRECALYSPLPRLQGEERDTSLCKKTRPPACAAEPEPCCSPRTVTCTLRGSELLLAPRWPWWRHSKLQDLFPNLLFSKFVSVLLPACFTHSLPLDSAVNMNVFVHFRSCSRVSRFTF